MPDGILAGGRTFFLLSVGLDDINLTVLHKCPINKVIELRLGNFPIAMLIGRGLEPFGIVASAVAKPLPIVSCVRKLHAQMFAFAVPPEHDRDCFLLLPYEVEGKVRFSGVAFSIMKSRARFRDSKCDGGSESRSKFLIQVSRLRSTLTIEWV